MDSPEVAINAIHPLTVDSENNGLIISPTPTVTVTASGDPMPIDKDDTCGEMLEGQNVDGVYSGLPEGGNLQVRFSL